MQVNILIPSKIQIYTIKQFENLFRNRIKEIFMDSIENSNQYKVLLGSCPFLVY